MPTTPQAPRFNTAPSPRGYSVHHADNAIELAAGYGLICDPWQAEVVRSWLRSDKGGWVSSTWGLSCARQNGKNGALEVVELYMMIALGAKILHTSHLLASARKAFKRLMYFFGSKTDDPYAKFPELNALVKEIRKTNGQEAIELHGGGLIELGARTSGAGRGSSFDLLVVDEGQEYEEDEQEALEPTTSAAPSGDPITVYMGTPPRDLGGRGEPFVRIRNAAITGADKRSAWVEYSPAGDVDRMDEAALIAFTSDRKNWASGNPALGGRLSLRAVETEHAKWSPRSYARERLNAWPTPSASGKLAFTADKWDALAIESPDDEWPTAAYGVDMNPERTKVSIGVAARSGDGLHLELAADAPFDEAGTPALVAWLWERCKRRVPVVLEAYSPARATIEVALRNRGLRVYILSSSEYMQACMTLQEAVEVRPSITHFGQEQLDASVKNATQAPVKNYPGSFKWSRARLDVDLAPVMAITCAYFGALKFAKQSNSGESKKRYAIVG